MPPSEAPTERAATDTGARALTNMSTSFSSSGGHFVKARPGRSVRPKTEILQGSLTAGHLRFRRLAAAHGADLCSVRTARQKAHELQTYSPVGCLLGLYRELSPSMVARTARAVFNRAARP